MLELKLNHVSKKGPCGNSGENGSFQNRKYFNALLKNNDFEGAFLSKRSLLLQSVYTKMFSVDQSR